MDNRIWTSNTFEEARKKKKVLVRETRRSLTETDGMRDFEEKVTLEFGQKINICIALFTMISCSIEEILLILLA